MKTTSCGVLVISNNKLLGCKAPGKTLLDIPKGKMEEFDLDYTHTALRELYEETGIMLTQHLYEIGKFRYTKEKNIVLFLLYQDVDISKCTCTSYFDNDGVQVPEVIGYEWVDFWDVNKFYKSLQPILYPVVRYINETKNTRI